MFYGETVPDINEDATGTVVIGVDVKGQRDSYPAQVQHILIVYCRTIILVKQLTSGSQEMRPGNQARAGPLSRRLGLHRLLILICKDQVTAIPPRPKRRHLHRYRLQQVFNLRNPIYPRQLPTPRLLAPQIHRRQEHGQLSNIIL